MLLGVDDTDSLEGGCTTHVALVLARHIQDELGYVLLDYPRLVRLNPTNPWKTRGNAAIVLPLGRGYGDPMQAGEWLDEPIECYFDGQRTPPTEEVLDLAWEVVLENTWHEDGRTNPGIVLSPGPLDPDRYREALDRILHVWDTEGRIIEEGLLHRGEGSRRGLIGAYSALAWPREPHTWELLAYRSPGMWGTPREVDPASVKALADKFHGTFDSYDVENDVQTIAPSSPCPVLYGIRSVDPYELRSAVGSVRGEAPGGWLLFRTNQGTDDHIRPKHLPDVVPHESVAVQGTVVDRPRTIEGGHVLVGIEHVRSRLTIAAYEPTKGFRDVVRGLVPGDEVYAVGSVRDEPRTLNLEKLNVLSLGTRYAELKVGNPRCPECGRSMKSVGLDAGYRCPRCGTKAGEDQVKVEHHSRGLSPGWYEVPPVARRHLARPLKLGVRSNIDLE